MHGCLRDGNGGKGRGGERERERERKGAGGREREIKRDVDSGALEPELLDNISKSKQINHHFS